MQHKTKSGIIIKACDDPLQLNMYDRKELIRLLGQIGKRLIEERKRELPQPE